jgi:hypothetical protein
MSTRVKTQKNLMGTMTIRDTDRGLNNMVGQLAELDGKRVMVGWLEDVPADGGQNSVLRMAVLNEMGMMDQGIPENAPLRRTMDDGFDKFLKLMTGDLYVRLLKGDRVGVVLDQFGEEFLKELREQIEAPAELGRILHGSSGLKQAREAMLRDLREKAQFRVEN